jgi:colicin import membrane protein
MQPAAALSAHPGELRYAEPGQKPAAVLAVLVHVLLFVFLFFGLRWSAKAPEAVVVELWTQPAVSEPVPKAAPVPEPRPEPKVEPLVEPPPKPVARVEPPKPAPAPKAAAPVKKPDIVVEKDKKPARREEPKLQIDARTRMQEQLARETQSLAQERQKVTPPAAAPAPPAAAPVIDPGYTNKIRQKIKGNIIVPPDIPGNPEAIFDVIQIPGGDVLSVKLRKPSGFPAFDDAVERAILKSSPLPRPDNPAQFQRQLELKFRPRE